MVRAWAMVTGASKELERSKERIEAKSLCKLFSCLLSAEY
jgi:hypothetical protein